MHIHFYLLYIRLGKHKITIPMTLTSLVLFLFPPSLPFWIVLPSAFLLIFPHCFPHHHLTSSISCHASLRALGEHVCRTGACFWWESIYAVFIFYVTVFCRESWSYTQRTWHLSWFPLLDMIELSGRGNLSWKHASVRQACSTLF